MAQFVYELSLQWGSIMCGAILIFDRPVNRALRRDEDGPTLARFFGLASAHPAGSEALRLSALVNHEV